MINKVNVFKYKIGTRISDSITVDGLKELLSSGLSIHEEYTNNTYSRVLFCWGGKLFVRAAHSPLGYIQCLPKRLSDASTIDDYHIHNTIIKGLIEGRLTLTVLSFMPFYQEAEVLEVLKDF